MIDVALILIADTTPDIIISKYGLGIFLGLMGISFVIAGIIMKLRDRKRSKK